MSRIHPTAVVDGGAVLADGVEIGPWCIVGPGVTLESDVRLVSHAVVQQDTTVGARTVIHPFAVIGGDPQHNADMALDPLDKHLPAGYFWAMASAYSLADTTPGACLAPCRRRA
jgi:carbonic anhydrase/acetyltransferase-like protein (isoleucine patch superfamily)